MKVLSPIGDPASDRLTRAPRIARLDGGAIGLLSNGKPNADNLLDAIHAEITGGRGTPLRFNKSKSAHGPAFAATEGVFERLSSSTVAVLVASGD